MQHKPKLIYIITQGGPWGGAQRYVFDLATQLADTYDVTVAVGEPDGEQDLQKKIPNKIATVQLQHLRRNISPVHDLLAFFELKKLYKKIEPNIIHLNSSKAGILGSLATSYKLQATSCHTIYTAHGWVFNEPMPAIKRALYSWAEKITATYKDTIIVLSEQDKKTAVETLGLPEKKLQTIPLGITTPKFLSPELARAALQKYCPIPWPNNSVLFGTVANFYQTKGLDVLIDAFATIAPKNPQIHLLFIGDGPERAHLEQKILSHHLEHRVHLLGFVPDASTHLKAFQYFVLPSRKEGLPYTLIEAAMADVPIIATNVGGIPSLIEHNKTGMLVEPNNVSALGQALQAALKDETTMRRLTQNALAIHDKFSLEKMAATTLAVYQSASRAKSN